MAVRLNTLTGTDKVLRNLNKEIKGIRGRTKAGLMAAGLVVKRRSMIRTPVDTGNLINSAYITPTGTRTKPGVEIGYTASYAPYVHEIQRSYKKPGSSWKFLEKALKESVKDIVQIIRDHARIRR